MSEASSPGSAASTSASSELGYASSDRAATAMEIIRDGCNAHGGCLDQDECLAIGRCLRVEEARAHDGRLPPSKYQTETVRR